MHIAWVAAHANANFTCESAHHSVVSRFRGVQLPHTALLRERYKMLHQ
jgi:hypothetical protein